MRVLWEGVVECDRILVEVDSILDVSEEGSDEVGVIRLVLVGVVGYESELVLIREIVVLIEITDGELVELMLPDIDFIVEWELVMVMDIVAVVLHSGPLQPLLHLQVQEG